MAQDSSDKPLSIFIIDDDEYNRSTIASRLSETAGWSLAVETAHAAADAFEKLKGAAYDLILLDNGLPDASGLDVLDRIRQLHPKTAVVLMTAAGNEQLAVSAMKKGALDYMTQEALRRMDLSHLLRRVIELRYLVDQNMELRQVNQMKTEFIANVSHELRTPLSVIMGYAQTLKTGGLGPLSEGQAKAIDAILARSEGLLEKILNMILRVRESHEGKQQLVLEPLELRSFLSEAAAPNKEMSRKSISLERRFPAAEVWVKADRAAMIEVLENVLSNAGKFAGENSTVSLALEIKDREAVVSIRDEGPGVAQEMLPKLFETFGATNKGPTREHGGLGLGLPLSRQIVEKHSGRIWLESNNGKGTTVFIALPLSDKAAATKKIEAPFLSKKRILIVEDNPDIVDIVRLFLSTISHNFEVTAAQSGFEALDAIKNQIPDLMILDVMMPGMNGFEVIERLRKAPQTAKLPIMVLTGYSEAVSRAKQAGAQEVMLKPFEKDVFAQKLLALLK